MLSTNMSTQIVNGKVSQTASYTYNYTVQAKKAGTYTLPPASVVVGGKKYSSNKVTLQVVKGTGAAKQNTGQRSSSGQTTANQSEISSKDLYVRIQVDRRNIYKGEQILATIKVYTRVNLARFGDIKIPAYSGAKAAVSNFTQWLAVHFSKVGIRVNALAPGFFLTDQNRTLLTESNGELTPRGKTIIGQTPMGRFGEPEDLVGTTLWLCGEGASFVTGVVVPIDGGFSAFSGV